METKQVIHRFEEAGLGKAPFHLSNVTYGWTSCHYCGTPIKECCHITDINGKSFIVGNVCVDLTGDRGLIDVVKREINRLRKERRHEKEKIVIENGLVLMHDSKVLELLKKLPHPNKQTFYNDKNLYDYLMVKHNYSGNKGKMEITKEVTEIIENSFGKGEVESILINRGTILARMEQEKLDEIEEDRKKREEVFKNKQIEIQGITVENLDIIKILEATNSTGSFVRDMIGQLKCKRLKDFSPRQIEVIQDIYSKSFGKRNSKDYNEAFENFKNRF